MLDKIQEKSKEKQKTFLNQIPEEILNNKLLNEVIKVLPENYNFEIHKTIWWIQEFKKSLQRNIKVVLQLPQGLQMFATRLSDIIMNFTDSEIMIIADENYGACCIEDQAGYLFGADFIVHYGHSCLVPIPQTLLKTMYVFVDIIFDVNHLFETIMHNFRDKNQHLFLMGVVQFNQALFLLRNMLKEKGYNNIEIPQDRPWCVGEVLGCTAPVLELNELKNTVIFVADGKFHMEGAMLSNPKHRFFKYHPFEQELIYEEYDFERMIQIRASQIEMTAPQKGVHVGIIQGLLGRQGNPLIVNRIKKALDQKQIKYSIILISEIFPQQLKCFGDQIDIFVQIACPRLSTDWGNRFHKPLLNPYEFHCWINQNFPKKTYRNDFYSNEGGEWSNYYKEIQNNSNKNSQENLKEEQIRF